MKVKTWIRRYVSSTWVEDEKVKNLLLDNKIYNFYIYKEQILDIDVSEIIDSCKNKEKYEAGYRYSNRLYDLVHCETRFIGEKGDLEFEIIEQDYPTDIPYAYCEFDDADEFHKWMLVEGAKEREELNERW